MSHHDHASAIAGGDAQVGKDGGCGGVVKRARRLVGEDIGRLGQQCPGDGHTYCTIFDSNYVINILKNLYGIEEADLLSAELEIVPAGPARDMGFDRSMILGYGHDDRSCSYPSLIAQLECDTPARTSVTILTDKEEIGSVGATGMNSLFFENIMAEVLALAGFESPLSLRRCRQNRI